MLSRLDLAYALNMHMDPADRPSAILLARAHGYREDRADYQLQPGACALSGIDAEYCHCGRHP